MYVSSSPLTRDGVTDNSKTRHTAGRGIHGLVILYPLDGFDSNEGVDVEYAWSYQWQCV
jgi:hypothetical protein